MNTQFCKVGTIRPNLSKVLNATKTKSKLVKLKTKKTDSTNKLPQ
jgi:hypothetical protein